jgi:hypothetical protein
LVRPDRAAARFSSDFPPEVDIAQTIAVHLEPSPPGYHHLGACTLPWHKSIGRYVPPNSWAAKLAAAAIGRERIFLAGVGTAHGQP